jgi:hypothetical protein
MLKGPAKQSSMLPESLGENGYEYLDPMGHDLWIADEAVPARSNTAGYYIFPLKTTP